MVTKPKLTAEEEHAIFAWREFEHIRFYRVIDFSDTSGYTNVIAAVGVDVHGKVSSIKVR